MVALSEMSWCVEVLNDVEVPYVIFCKDNAKEMNNICNDVETGAFETGVTRRAGISISTIVC